jgi:hypothetical protein
MLHTVPVQRNTVGVSQHTDAATNVALWNAQETGEDSGLKHKHLCQEVLHLNPCISVTSSQLLFLSEPQCLSAKCDDGNA